MNEQLGAGDRTRRTVLRCCTGGAAAGAVALLAGCGKHADTPAASAPAPVLGDADVTILNQLLDREYRAIAAYTAGIPLLDGSAHDAAKQFLLQELYHASKLYTMIKHAGGKPLKEKASYPLGRPRTRKDVLALLHRLEHDEVTGYLAAIPAVSYGQLRGVLAAILANDAQHVVLLRSELNLEPLLGAFLVSGE